MTEIMNATIKKIRNMTVEEFSLMTKEELKEASKFIPYGANILNAAEVTYKEYGRWWVMTRDKFDNLVECKYNNGSWELITTNERGDELATKYWLASISSMVYYICDDEVTKEVYEKYVKELEDEQTTRCID